MKDTKHYKLLIFLKLWVEFLAGATIVLSLLSLFSAMKLGGWIALFCGLGWAAYRMRELKWDGWYQGIKKHWIFIILASFCFVSLALGPHCVLDSYIYRIPQILLWLQEGHPWSVPYVDWRINQMPHIWPFISAIFFLPFGERGLALPNFISLLLLYGILVSFLNRLGTTWSKSQWILAIFIASPVIVMQAASNDNVLACVTLLMISLYFALYGKSTTETVVYSAIAFSMACGIKPQYMALAPLWILWFFWGKAAPWKLFKWNHFIWLVPLVILCSPLPDFAVNQFVHGSYMYPNVVDATLETVDTMPPKASDYSGKDRQGTYLSRSIHSYVSLANHLTALPVNPLADRMNRMMRQAAEKHAFFRVMDFETQKVYPLLITEFASLSFIATLALVVGLLFCRGASRVYTTLAWGSFLALITAVQLTTPYTVARSFVGFFLLMLPLAFYGLIRLPRKILALGGAVAMIAGIITIILNPARPMWPSVALVDRIADPTLKNKVIQYNMFFHRHESGRDLVESIPQTERIVGAIVWKITPLVEFWKPYELKRRVRFYSPSVTWERLKNDGVSYLIIKHPGLTGSLDEFLEHVRGEIVQTKYYTSFMIEGARAWHLVRIHS
jgi:hypothetical protein